ncbi:MAG: hypothetical protein JSS53_09480 [Proteobacteria bacterium]|nr:hypothetical protein [Pseudomonadota bacterium]
MPNICSFVPGLIIGRKPSGDIVLEFDKPSRLIVTPEVVALYETSP